MAGLVPYSDANEQRAFVSRLRACPAGQLIGVIDPGGPFMSTVSNDAMVLHVPLCAWRVDGDEVTHRSLVVHHLPETSGMPRMRDLRNSDIVRVLAHVETDHALVAGSWELQVTDTSLSQAVQELQEPVVVQTSFGELTLNRGTHAFEANVDWLGEQVDLILETASKEALSGLIEHAEAVLGSCRAWDNKCREFTISDEGYGEVADDDFLSAVQGGMKLSSFSIDPSGGLSFCFEFEAFHGHLLIVRGSINGDLAEVEIVG